MRTRGGLALAVIWLAAALLVAAPAEAKFIRYTGTTSQGLRVTLKTNAKGKAQYLAIKFDPVCGYGDFDVVTQRFVAPFRKADYKHFVDAFKQTIHFKDSDAVGKARTRLEGRRVDRDRIRGTFKSRLRLFEDGKQFNACHAPHVTWSATRHGS